MAIEQITIQEEVSTIREGIRRQSLAMWYADDPKRTVRRLSVLASPMCSVPPEEVEQFWASRWNQNPNFDYELVNQLYPIKRVFDETMNERVIMQLLDLEL
jgi:hypothetical protein